MTLGRVTEVSAMLVAIMTCRCENKTKTTRSINDLDKAPNIYIHSKDTDWINTHTPTHRHTGNAAHTYSIHSPCDSPGARARMPKNARARAQIVCLKTMQNNWCWIEGCKHVMCKHMSCFVSPGGHGDDDPNNPNKGTFVMCVCRSIERQCANLYFFAYLSAVTFLGEARTKGTKKISQEKGI